MVMDRRFNVEKDLNTYLSLDFSRDLTPLYQNVSELSEFDKMEEFMILGLRLTKGVSGSEFYKKFGHNMFSVFEKAINKNMLLKLLNYRQPNLFLTEKGLDLSNRVMSDFLFDR